MGSQRLSLSKYNQISLFSQSIVPVLFLTSAKLFFFWKKSDSLIPLIDTVSYSLNWFPEFTGQPTVHWFPEFTGQPTHWSCDS